MIIEILIGIILWLIYFIAKSISSIVNLALPDSYYTAWEWFYSFTSGFVFIAPNIMLSILAVLNLVLFSMLAWVMLVFSDKIIKWIRG